MITKNSNPKYQSFIFRTKIKKMIEVYKWANNGHITPEIKSALRYFADTNSGFVSRSDSTE